MTDTSANPAERMHEDLSALRLPRDDAWDPPHRRRRWPWVAAMLVSVLAVLVWWQVGKSVEVVVAPVSRVTAAEVGPMPILSGSGYIVTGERYVSIGVRVPGRIERYFVEEGQSVRKGDPLVQLDDRDYRAQVTRAKAQLAVAKAQLELAEADLRRVRALHEQRVASQQELDVQESRARVARAAVQQAEADLQQARVNLDYTILRAPTDGVILAKTKEVGEIAVPGGFAGSGDLIRMANLSDIRAQVDVNEADLNRVFMGQKAVVTPDAYPDAKYEAEVVKFYPQVDRSKGTLRIEVRLSAPDEKLLPDMSARVTFLSQSQPADAKDPMVFVPSAAVRRNERGEAFVWVVNEARVHARPVRLGATVAGRVQVLSGLNGDERVVVSGTALREGQRIRIRQS
ncbi:MAG: resistance-nodulation-cell division efflux membrane fusion protein [Candidatus Binatia bacterium]|nr:MAG: resistance-nodulation-cell division efflux membrane fusion protein [Candidatus Binatia bacterium]